MKSTATFNKRTELGPHVVVALRAFAIERGWHRAHAEHIFKQRGSAPTGLLEERHKTPTSTSIGSMLAAARLYHPSKRKDTIAIIERFLGMKYEERRGG